MAKRPSPLTRYRAALQDEAFAGLVLLLGAAAALIWANSTWRHTYFAFTQAELSIPALGLNLTVAEWASDGLLAIFFFVVGLELKKEFTVGSLRDPKKAALPVLAALTGMLGPILVYTVVQHLDGAGGDMGGWAVPVATDIAFALGVLAIFGKGLPPAARVFLMTLAVADDLGGIIVIAIFFSSDMSWLFLGAAVLAIAAFYLVIRYKKDRAWILWPLGILAWYFMFRSGVHATIAAVALGMTVPTHPRVGVRHRGSLSLADLYDHSFEFWSSGVVLPIFALLSAGVSVVDAGGIGKVLTSPVTVGIYLALPLGKCIGIWGGTVLLTKVFKLRLDRTLNLWDVLPISITGGIGFTVSLLLATLSYPAGSPQEVDARIGVLTGTLLAAIIGGATLHFRARHQTRGLEPLE